MSRFARWWLLLCVVVAPWLAWLRNEWHRVRPYVDMPPSLYRSRRGRVLLRKVAGVGLVAWVVGGGIALEILTARQKDIVKQSIMLAMMGRRRTGGGSVSSGGSGGVSTYRGATLPSGITAPADLSAAFGGTTWDTSDLAIGGSRYNAATTLTVTTSGSTGMTDLAAHLATAAAGSVDYKIVVNVNTLSGSTLTLPAKSDATKHCWIVNTQINGGSFGTPAGTKVAASTTNMVVIEGPASSCNSVVVFADSGSARGYSFHGCVIQNNQSSASYDVALGVVEMRRTTAQTTMSGYSGKLWIDRCWIRGSTTTDIRRGILANGPYLKVNDSRVSEVHCVGNESAGIAGWTGCQFHDIRNCTIEAGTQAMLYGGADPDQPGTNTLDPADIFVDKVYAFKPLTWLTSHPSYAGTHWTCKTGFEAKNCRRWVIDRSWTQNVWPDAQNGYAMLFQNLSDGNTNDTVNRIEDIVVRHHKFDYVANGLNVLARVAYGGGTLPANRASRLVFDNIAFSRCGGNRADSTAIILNGLSQYLGITYQLLQDIDQLIIDRATSDAVGGRWMILSGSGGTNWTITNHVAEQGDYGIFADGGAVRNTALTNACGTGLTLAGNVGYDLASGSYSSGGNFAETNSSMLFNNYSGYDYALTSAHLTEGVSGGQPGCDLATLNTQLSGINT